jgi:hypothetical protein
MFRSLLYFLFQALQTLFRDVNISPRGLIRFLLEAVKNVDGAPHSHIEKPEPKIPILGP